MTRRLLPPLAAAALALALAQCDSPVEAPPQGDMYVLESINGSPLPATLVEGDWGRQEVLADTFWLAADGSGTERMAGRNVLTTSAAPEPWSRESYFHYTLGADGAIEIGYECRDVVIYDVQASCAPPPHLVGQVSADGMRLNYVHVHRDKVFVFRRVE